MLKQLTAFDAIFLYAETAETPGHVGGLSLVQLPDGYRGDFYEDYKTTIATRIRHVPFLHHKVVELPFQVDHPFWVEVPKVDVDSHVRHLTAPRPGRMDQVEDLVALLHGQLLDRSRPLWEFYVIDGLENGQVAIYTKMHHAAMDGASSMALITTMYDPTPRARSFTDPGRDDLDDEVSLAEVVRGLATSFVRRQVRAAQFLPELLKAWNRVLLPDPTTLQFAAAPGIPRGPRTPFNVGITSQRVYAARTMPLSVVKRIGKATGTTVNDVVLAICAGAVRGYLQEKGVLPDAALSAMVPVSLRAGDTSTANQNGMFLASLATDVADPYQRLQAIHRSAAAQKQRLEDFKEVPLPDVSLAGMGAMMHWLVGLAGRRPLGIEPPYLGNVLVSNVPGPPQPLYIAGARILSMYPCSIPFHGSALNITAESYCDRLDFGLIACRRAVPDLALIADGLLEALVDLQHAVAEHDQAPAPEGTASPTLH
jgi:WS/DGAT/MGAT family acyltransferase